VLDKNGLTNGKIYVLAGRDAQHNEGTFTSGSLPVKWVEIPSAASLDSAGMASAADAAGGFGFVRVEDSEFDPTNPTRSMFIATTGGSSSNRLGRLYEITMNPTSPTSNGTLNVIYNADTIIYPSGTYSGAATGRLSGQTATGSFGTYTQGVIGTTDYPVSIDNIAVSKDFIICCEDRNSPADAVFSAFNRNGGTWTLDRKNNYAAKLQCTFNYAYTQGRDQGVAPTSSTSNSRGLWETSGVIDSSAIFGPGTFVINVQAHLQAVPVVPATTPPTTTTTPSMRANCPDGLGGVLSKSAARSNFAEDGQVLIMRLKP
jgi:hypothetical protein